MDSLLDNIYVLDAVLPFAAGLLFCGWLLWDLRKENRKAEARKQAALAAAASFGAPAPRMRRRHRSRHRPWLPLCPPQ